MSYVEGCSTSINTRDWLAFIVSLTLSSSTDDSTCRRVNSSFRSDTTCVVFGLKLLYMRARVPVWGDVAWPRRVHGCRVRDYRMHSPFVHGQRGLPQHSQQCRRDQLCVP